MNINAGWVAAGVLLLLYVRRAGGGGVAVVKADDKGVSADDVAKAVPRNAGAMALDMWARSHANDLGSAAMVGSGPLDRAGLISRGWGL